MAVRSRIPLAIIVFLLGGSAGVTAIGFSTTTSDLPGSFHAAQPLPGDRAEWAFTIVDANGPSAKALAFLRVEERAPISTWNRSGDPHPARLIHFEEAAHGRWDRTGTTPVPFAWYFRTTEARGPDGVYWYASSNGKEGQQSQGSMTWQAESLRYMDGASRIVGDCLLNHLPKHLNLDRPIAMPTCMANAPAVHPDRPMTGREISAQNATVGKWVMGGDWRAIGQSVTPHGPALVLDYIVKGSSWGVRAWYVESFPYPVQMTVELNGATWIHQITDLTRGTPRGPPPAIAPLPPVSQDAIMPWGPADAGIRVPLLPSDAYRAARDDPSLGLGAWLRSHPGAYAERLEGGHGHNGEADWNFQLRAGDERFAFTVTRVATDIPEFPFYKLPHYETKVSSALVEAVAHSATSPPASLPDLASADVRFRAATGQEAQRWEYTWGCTDWVRHDICQGISGPVVHARATVVDGSGLTGVVQGSDEATTEWTMLSAPRGGIQGIHRNTFTAHQQPLLAESSEPEPAVPVQPAAAAAWAVPPVAAVATIGAAAGLLATLYLVWPMLKSAAIPLFSRIHKDRLLDHPNRQRLYEAIEETPGIHHQVLVDLLGQGRGTVDHHLRKMEAGGIVRARTSNGYRCYFLHATDRRVIEAAASLRSGTAQRVLAYARDHPGTTGGQVAAALGINRSTVSHHVKRLEGAGLLRGERRGNAICLWAVTGMVAAAGPMLTR